jgi:hypothetical protein
MLAPILPSPIIPNCIFALLSYGMIRAAFFQSHNN